jgi:hypothetical protein
LKYVRRIRADTKDLGGNSRTVTFLLTKIAHFATEGGRSQLCMHSNKLANAAHSPQGACSSLSYGACSSLSYDDCRRTRCLSWGGYSHTGKRGALHQQPAAPPVVYLSTTERAWVCVARVFVARCTKSLLFVGHLPEVFGVEISFAACVGNNRSEYIRGMNQSTLPTFEYPCRPLHLEQSLAEHR